ncbi:hypothetical protein BDN72DRAFT_901022 [Pluteus cervinus]|uniref:Uncharacterized protein n=1 Tax=Pluteus cervinus TaxID=181527 RepID=A0ACD3AGM3_9AGAR|nr:hypothetical protein BDN72DRAFT_901022 [Pluteus cervinus]
MSTMQTTQYPTWYPPNGPKILQIDDSEIMEVDHIPPSRNHLHDQIPGPSRHHIQGHENFSHASTSYSGGYPPIQGRYQHNIPLPIEHEQQSWELRIRLESRERELEASKEDARHWRELANKLLDARLATPIGLPGAAPISSSVPANSAPRPPLTEAEREVIFRDAFPKAFDPNTPLSPTIYDEKIHRNITYWDEATWNTIQNSNPSPSEVDPASKSLSAKMAFLQQLSGRQMLKDRYDQLLIRMSVLCTRVKRGDIRLLKGSWVDIHNHDYTFALACYKQVESEYPELSYGANHWKSRKLFVGWYRQWVKKHVQGVAVKEEPREGAVVSSKKREGAPRESKSKKRTKTDETVSTSTKTGTTSTQAPSISHEQPSSSRPLSTLSCRSPTEPPSRFSSPAPPPASSPAPPPTSSPAPPSSPLQLRLSPANEHVAQPPSDSNHVQPPEPYKNAGQHPPRGAQTFDEGLRQRTPPPHIEEDEELVAITTTTKKSAKQPKEAGIAGGAGAASKQLEKALAAEKKPATNAKMLCRQHWRTSNPSGAVTAFNSYWDGLLDEQKQNWTTQYKNRNKVPVLPLASSVAILLIFLKGTASKT